MPDLRGVLNLLPRVAIAVQRAGAGSTAGGVWTPGATTSTPGTAVWQPLSPRQAAFLPEGVRESARVVAWVGLELEVRTADVAAGLREDLITTGGRTYRVLQVEDWRAFGSFQRVILGDATAAE
jgi:hypothetical protein